MSFTSIVSKDNPTFTTIRQHSDMKFTLTFDANGGISSTIVKDYSFPSDTYGEMPTPTRTGFKFTGWFTKREHGEGTKVLTTDVAQIATRTVYAHWVEIEPNLDGAAVSDSDAAFSVDMNSDMLFNMLPSPAKANWFFGGWYAESEHGEATTHITSTTDIDDLIETIYGHWVELDVGGGTFPDSTTTYRSTDEAHYSTLPTPTQPSKKFLGWYTGTNSGTKVRSGTYTSLDDSISTLHAYWLSFDAAGGALTTTSVTASLNTNTNYNTMPLCNARTNYQFLGWFTSASGGTKVYSSSIILENLPTVYAHWLKLELDGGGDVTPANNASATTSTYNAFSIPIKSGCKFLGWYTSTAYSTKLLTTNPISATITTAYALWLSFESEGGSAVTSPTASLNSSTLYGTLPTSVLSGSKFLGWYTSKEGGKKILEGGAIDGSLKTAYAMWVAFESNGGEAVTDVIPAKNTDSLYFTMPLPSCDGYKLVGWFADDEQTVEKTAASTIDTTVKTLTAKWIQKQKVTFHAGEGTASKSEEYYAPGYSYGEFGLAETTYEGHAFVAWYATEDFTGDMITEETIFDGVVTDLYAKYADSITINFNANGGTCSTTSSVHAPGSLYSAVGLPTPTWSGYVFEGWHVGSADGNRIGLDKTVACESHSADFTVYAKWLKVSDSSNTFIALLNAKCNALYATPSISFSEVYKGQSLGKSTSYYKDSAEPFSVTMSRSTYSSGSTNYLVATSTCGGTLSYYFKGTGTGSSSGYTRCNAYYILNNGSQVNYVSNGGTSGLTSWTQKSISLTNSGSNTLKLWCYGYSYSSSYHRGLYLSKFSWTPSTIGGGASS